MAVDEICDTQVPNLIRKLRRFLGGRAVDRALRAYGRSLASAGPVYRQYYLERRHPWWNAWLIYEQEDREGRSLATRLSPGVRELAADAHKIGDLQKEMPEAVKRKYRTNLLGDQAAPHFFELKVAWHYRLLGSRINWYHSPSARIPDFAVSHPDIEFDVECKHLSVDTFRRIRRRDFYRLAEMVIPPIASQGLSGIVEVFVVNRLPKNEKELAAIRDAILASVTTPVTSVSTSQSEMWGRYTLDLVPASPDAIDPRELAAKLRGLTPPEAHGAIFAWAQEGKALPPVSLVCRSEKADTLLKGIRRELCEAAERQLSRDRPGMLCCHVPEVDDFSVLRDEGGLAAMTTAVLEDSARNHVAAVIYSSETRSMGSAREIALSAQALSFRNPRCKFSLPARFPFINETQ